jgi:nucleotide-binding universal stress UspA family protein
MIGIDGSEEASAAVDWLLQLPIHRTARMTVVSVVPLVPVQLSRKSARLGKALNQVRVLFEEEARRMTEETGERIQKDGFEVATIVAHGQPAAELVTLAESEEADLLVVGSRGLGGTAFFIGSVSDAVLKYAPCSVLVCRLRTAKAIRSVQGFVHTPDHVECPTGERLKGRREKAIEGNSRHTVRK